MSSAAAPEPVKPNLEAADVLPAALPPFDIGAALNRLDGDTLLLRRLPILFHDTYADQ